MASLKYKDPITGEWTNLNLNGSNSIIIDSTLSQSGQAADAKAVGDKFIEFEKKVNSDIFVTDDGNGNINVEIITVNMSVTDNGSGNITLF